MWAEFCIERRWCNFLQRVLAAEKLFVNLPQRMNSDTSARRGKVVWINLKVPWDGLRRVTLAGIRKFATRLIGAEWKVHMEWLLRRLRGPALSRLNQIKKTLLLIKPWRILLLVARGKCRVEQIMTQLDQAKTQLPLIKANLLTGIEFERK
jgi:hypothetical protein